MHGVIRAASKVAVLLRESRLCHCNGSSGEERLGFGNIMEAKDASAKLERMRQTRANIIPFFFSVGNVK